MESNSFFAFCDELLNFGPDRLRVDGGGRGWSGRVSGFGRSRRVGPGGFGKGVFVSMGNVRIRVGAGALTS